MPKIISNGIEYVNGESFSGNYEDLEGKPTVFGPSGPNAKDGFVPSPGTTAGTQKYLREDGTWVKPPDTNTTYSNMTGATASAAGNAGLVPAPAKGAANRYLRSDGTWQVPPDNNTTYSDMTGATASAAGTHGLAPAPPAGAQVKYLTGGATYQNVDDHAAAFTSNDVADGEASVWTSVTKLASGETHKSIFNKLSTMFKNVRYLYKLMGTTDISAIGGGTVTGAISALNTGKALLDNPEMHRNIFRGKNLGNAFTAQQKAAIANGSFDDLYVGDYWVINNIIWRIVDINYWIGTGDTECTTNHLVIMPDAIQSTGAMNDTRTTAGGYVGSNMFNNQLESISSNIKSMFGANCILLHREYLVNSVTNGLPSGGNWYNSEIELPNEIMMYGCRMFSPSGNGSGGQNNYTVDKTQLALMRLRQEFICPNRKTFWIRDPISNEHFATVNSNGNSGYQAANVTNNIRPVFGLKGV